MNQMSTVDVRTLVCILLSSSVVKNHLVISSYLIMLNFLNQLGFFFFLLTTLLCGQFSQSLDHV